MQDYKKISVLKHFFKESSKLENLPINNKNLEIKLRWSKIKIKRNNLNLSHNKY